MGKYSTNRLKITSGLPTENSDQGTVFQPLLRHTSEAKQPHSPARWVKTRGMSFPASVLVSSPWFCTFVSNTHTTDFQYSLWSMAYNPANGTMNQRHRHSLLAPRFTQSEHMQGWRVGRQLHVRLVGDRIPRDLGSGLIYRCGLVLQHGQ